MSATETEQTTPTTTNESQPDGASVENNNIPVTSKFGGSLRRVAGILEKHADRLDGRAQDKYDKRNNPDTLNATAIENEAPDVESEKRSHKFIQAIGVGALAALKKVGELPATVGQGIRNLGEKAGNHLNDKRQEIAEAVTKHKNEALRHKEDRRIANEAKRSARSNRSATQGEAFTGANLDTRLNQIDFMNDAFQEWQKRQDEKRKAAQVHKEERAAKRAKLAEAKRAKANELKEQRIADAKELREQRIADAKTRKENHTWDRIWDDALAQNKRFDANKLKEQRIADAKELREQRIADAKTRKENRTPVDLKVITNGATEKFKLWGEHTKASFDDARAIGSAAIEAALGAAKNTKRTLGEQRQVEGSKR